MSDIAIFLDRDDTLIEDIGYISDPAQVKLIDGAAEALVEFKKLGYKLIVVSNQSGIARGYFTEETLAHIHEKLEQLFRQKGAYLDKIYYCPYLADAAIEKYRIDSDDRKPKPGMLLKAASELNINLAKSWMIGDGQRDIDAGLAAGCKTILIRPSAQTITLNKDISTNADHIAVNMREAVNIVKKFKYAPAPQPVTPTIASKNIAQPQKPIELKMQPIIEQKQTAVQIPLAVSKPVSETSQPVAAKPAANETPKNKPAAENKTLVSENVPPADQKASAKSPGKDPQSTTTATSDMQPDSNYLLNEILNELKALRRTDLFGDFSIMRLLAGMVQIIVLLCLLICIWILMNPAKSDSNSILVTLGFAGVLQIMALTFYVQSRK